MKPTLRCQLVHDTEIPRWGQTFEPRPARMRACTCVRNMILNFKITYLKMRENAAPDSTPFRQISYASSIFSTSPPQQHDRFITNHAPLAGLAPSLQSNHDHEPPSRRLFARTGRRAESRMQGRQTAPFPALFSMSRRHFGAQVVVLLNFVSFAGRAASDKMHCQETIIARQCVRMQQMPFESRVSVCGRMCQPAARTFGNQLEWQAISPCDDAGSRVRRGLNDPGVGGCLVFASAPLSSSA